MTNPHTRGWMPIESAPRDGEATFLAFGDLPDAGGEHYEVVYYSPSEMGGITTADGHHYPGEDWCWATLDGPTFHKNSFTHWMPLPAPPTTSPEPRALTSTEEGERA